MLNFCKPVARCMVATLCVAWAASASAATNNNNVAPTEELPPARSSHDPRPTAPNPLSGRGATLVTQAGTGGPTAYGRAGVLELGGSVAYSGHKDDTLLMVAPSIGWFVANNFELSALVQLNHQQAKGGRESTFVTGLVEPSFHLPMMDQLYAFAGMGVGATYINGRDVGFALAPRVGFNAMVGRSGILTPSVAWNTSTNKTVTDSQGQTLLAVSDRWMANIGYSVMW